MTTYWVVFAFMALVILILGGWRQMIDLHEDDSLHLKEAHANVVTDQAALARKVGLIDRIGKTLTVLTLVYGLGLGTWAVYAQWIESAKLPG